MLHRIAFLFVLAFSLRAATLQIDCAKPEWKSLEPLKTKQFGPGDRILLKRGCAWTGQLTIQGSGSEGTPIVIAAYGEGPRPRIDGAGQVQDTVLIKNQQYIELRDLEVTNRGATSAVRRGVHIWLDDFGTAKHIVVSGLFIHDVNGDNKPKDNGGIIWRTSGRTTPTRFDGLLIERNIVWKVDRSAIAAQSAFVDRRRWFPSLNVVIRDNLVDDVGGDGIVPWASDGALIEHNIARDCNKRAGSYNAGIWPWSCDNTVMRLNEASFTRTLKDGQGFDSDYNSRNTLIERNYSHDNEGGFLLICTPRHDDPARMVTNIGVEVRNNISRNDKTRTFHISGPVENVRIHHNSVWIAPGDTVNLVQISDWKGWPDGVEFRANRFYVEGTARYGHEIRRFDDGSFEIGPGFGPAKNVRFEGNTYVGDHIDRPKDPAAITTGPIPKRDWNGPVFDPAKGGDFDKFLRRHRAWLERLLQ
jgi:translation initiation factor IF-1